MNCEVGKMKCKNCGAEIGDNTKFSKINNG